MKKIFSIAAVLMGVTTTASAADFPVVPAKAPLPVPAIFSWTGCYIGVEGGGNWGGSSQIARSGANANQPITGNYDLSGGIAGGTVGCNVQVSNFVLGIENDYSWTNKRGSALDQPPFVAGTTSSTREKWIDTLRGRFGYAIDRFMVYGTAGVAFAGTEVAVSNPLFGTVVDSKDRTGWVLGAGGEYAVWADAFADVTLKLEYLHAGFESKQYFVPPLAIAGGTIATRDTKLSDDMVRAGVNVKFNWGPPPSGSVVARY
ncbi:MAG TPA: outer membrane beta-barrel protein [Bradyrhizobium sp.]|jgi:outer membrane immunogenic protein|nr:outer membrane beta-barrel protein [Bradyrhizobium sp.]